MTDPLDKTHDSGDPKPAEGLAPGTQLGKYKLERVLGTGGMGVVWSAHDPDLERRVAIKVLRRADAGPALRTRLLREARAMARLKHPNVLTVYEVGSVGDRDFIAMELVDGASVDAWLDARPPHDEVWQAILAAGRGLAAAHAAGLVHRDFKPHNVLRSRDARVLVTDFGLARGSGEEHGPAVPVDPKIDFALDVTATPRRTDGVLDSTLTQPGQLIGTPAYMAPEQYDGAAPDPRTDQFAFCVTAWQALTGERPFDGRTIDEIRNAARGGASGIRAKMPRGVRAVLVRGLDPDPGNRWPDMDALLAGLERAARRIKLRSAAIWSVLLSIAIFLAIAGIEILFQRGTSTPPEAPKQANGCVPADDAFAEVWSADRRSKVEKHLGKGPAFSRVAEALDPLAKEWSMAYERACAGTGTASMARLSCLLGERDEMATYSRLLETMPATAFDRGLDLWGALPRIEACTVESPVSPPLMPEDRKLRDRIVALRVRMAELRMGQPDQFDKQMSGLLGDASWIGWNPLTAEIESAAGMAAQMTGDLAGARAHLAKAAELAEQFHDFKLEAASRIGLLEVEATASEHPGERGRAERLIEQARAAVRRAGEDPVLGGSIDLIVAGIDVDQGKFKEAISQYGGVRAELILHKAYRQLGLATANEIYARLRHDDPKFLEQTWQTGLQSEQLIDSKAPGTGKALAAALVELAWRRANYTEAHARADKIRHPLAPPGAIDLGGKVIAADGTPAVGATVVAWRGELLGDGSRAYIRGDFEGSVATTDASGAFMLKAPPDGALIAELRDARSQPVRIASDKPIVITLAPTRALTGHVRAAVLGDIAVAVRYELTRGTSWLDAAPLGEGGTFELTGVPTTGGTLILTRDGRTVSAGAPRDHAELAWPKGPTVDIIVRGTKGDTEVFVLRGRHDIHARAQVLALAKTETDLAVLPAHTIGFATETEMGAHQYNPGDLHALARDSTPGDITACAVPDDETAPVFCSSGNVPANGELAMALVPK